MGGDEFVIISPGMTPTGAEKHALVLDACAGATAQQICGERVLSVAIGTAFAPEDGASAEELLDIADKRMYAAKEARKRSMQMVPPMVNNSDQRLATVN